VTDEGRGVQAERGHPVEEGAERRPVVIEPAVERVDGVEDGLAVLPAQRRGREPAVARDEGRHALPGLLGGERVDRQVEVVVGMHVDEAGADDPPLGTDRPRRADARETPDLDDPPARHPEVGRDGGRAGAVEHHAARDHEIEHPHLLGPRGPPVPRSAGVGHRSERDTAKVTRPPVVAGLA
jgi:hypothetical protein